VQDLPVSDPGDVTLAGYEAAADHYVASSRPVSGDLAQYLDAFADLVGAGSVLELGSGPGHDAAYLEEQHGLRVRRTDATPAFVERLRRQGQEADLLDARTDDLGGPYGGVLADAVLLHLDPLQVEDLLARAHGAVAAGGALGITLKEGDGSAWSSAKLDVPRHFTYWREPALREVLTRTGWSVRSLDHVAGRLEPWLFVLAVRDRMPRRGRG
jgi:SAM-dependent methyltransferase